MPIVQISRIQHRRGKATDLPQLAAGELGWSIDDQKLYIGNGTLADGAPNIGNTEIVTAGSSSFTTALTHVYKGYLGDATTINTGNTTRTLQSVLDDYVSVKSFGAVGDGSTADVTAIQRAIDELYRDPDKTDARSRRILFFPAGTYNINASITIPPYAHLRGEGPDKTIINQSGGNAPVAVTEDNAGNVWPNIGSGSATTPTLIQIEGITFKNGEAYGGLSLDDATNVYIKNCKFQGTYAARGADAANSKGVTVRSSNSTTQFCSKIVFDQCIFTKFARLVDFSYDVTDVKFLNCDLNTSYYGALLGAEMDGSTAGLTNGPRHIIFNGGNWSTIGQQAIYVKPIAGANAGVGPRDIISHSNFYSHSVANNFEGYGSIREVPVIQYDNDECSSTLDFFERTDLRRSDGSSELNAAPEIQGIGIQTKVIKSQTLPDNTSTATVLNEFPALAGKGFMIKYKIVRGTLERTGEFKISGSTSSPLVSGSYTPAYDDDYRESNGDVGVELTADIVDKDSTSGTETLRIKFTTTNTSGSPGDATIDYQTTILA
jgi:hypothetical protein